MKFKIKVLIDLSEERRRELLRAINLHYLGDEEANTWDSETGFYVAKYEELETEAFNSALAVACMSHYKEIEVEFDPKTGGML